MRVLLCLVLLASLGGFGGVPMACITWQIITPDGVTFDLTGDGYLVSGVDNIGMPPVRTYTHQVPGQAGVVLDDMLDDARVVIVSHAATGTTGSKGLAAVFENMNDVMANYRYNRTLTLQPLRLRATLGAKSADLYCYYGGMVTAKVDNNRAIFGFTLVAYDPYWYATSETSTALDVIDTLAVHNIFGRISGLWTAMSDPGTGTVKCMAFDATGDLYVGGNFTDWDGIAAADYIAKYDVSAGTWAAVGATPLNGDVTDIAIAANNDIYITGTFTDAGGAATADRIAVLLSGGADWTTITPAGAADDTIFSLLLTGDNSLWAGGTFTTINAVAAEMVAKYNITTATWSAAAGLTGAGSVYDLAEGQDGTVFACGTFTNGGADPDADRLAQWDGSAWSKVAGALSGPGYSVCIAPDGELYVGGDFDTWNGQTVNNIGKWNGSAVSAMDSGVDDTVYALHIAADNTLYVSGIFSSAGGVAIFDGVVIWNGNSWQAISVTFPGAAAVYAITTDGDDLYFGFDTNGNASVPGDATVTYSGNVAFPPTITILCGATARTLYSIRNETTGVEILANLAVSPGETITIDLGAPGEIPAGKSVTSSWSVRPGGSNLLGKILSPTALTRFALAPAPIAASGANLISARMTGSGPTMTMKHYNRYDSLQAALD